MNSPTLRPMAAAAIAIFLCAPSTAARDNPVASGSTTDVPASPSPHDPIRRWNAMALSANALDHTPPGPGETRAYGEQLGPARTARAFAIVHIAMFDAINAVANRYQGYTPLPPALRRTSWRAAVAQAAHDTLVSLYPAQATQFGEQLAADLAGVGDKVAAERGQALGGLAAALILAARAADGALRPEPRLGIEYVPGLVPGDWRPDPINPAPIALGADWGTVRPFVLEDPEQFGRVPPPDLASAEYAAAFNEVRTLGGDGVATGTTRTPDQTAAGIFWAYDGTPGIGTPPRLFNQIAVHIATERGLDLIELARMLALVNVAMADVAIACWHEKYLFRFWRPVTGIREADPGTGRTGKGDGNPGTQGDPTFTPLGAPLSNAIGPNFTPPFPAYGSGHAAFGGAVFQMLRHVFGGDEIAFTFVSDELNGVTRDNTGQVRPLLPRQFQTLSEAEEENGQSRIYLGLHWAFDKTRGIAAGRQVSDYVVSHALRPR